jgi:hypothetical protein
MSDHDSFNFGKFVPGFDFLQNLAKGASQAVPQMPNLSNWVAPTLNVEELEKRIGELKAVHFWLDQNSKALGATIQALEVQKMTLATLKGMNFSMNEVADAFKLNPMSALFGGGDQKAGDKAAGAGVPASGAASGTATASQAAVKNKEAGNKTPTGVVDPLQWWGALTQQFQQIAIGAMKDAAAQSADVAKTMTSGLAQAAPATAPSSKARRVPAKRASKKAASR